MQPITRIFLSYLVGLVTYAWFVLRSERGTIRAIVLTLPLLLGNLCCCFFYQHVIICAHVAFYLGWLASFKLLCLAANRGPLVVPKVFNDVVSFAVVLLLPLVPHGVSSGHRRPDHRTHLRLFLVKLALLAFTVYGLHRGEYYFPGHKELLETFGLYAMLGVMYDGAGALVPVLFGFEILEPFNAPFIATSVTDFWRRWNLVAGSALRQLIYQPIVEGRFIRPRDDPALDASISSSSGSESDPSGHRQVAPSGSTVNRRTMTWTERAVRKAIALHAVFFACAVVHEAIFGLLMRTFTFRWFWFFLLQAPIMCMENVLHHVYRHVHKGRVIPRWIATPLTLVFELSLGVVLFFEPVHRTGLEVRVVAALRDLFI